MTRSTPFRGLWRMALLAAVCVLPLTPAAQAQSLPNLAVYALTAAQTVQTPFGPYTEIVPGGSITLLYDVVNLGGAPLFSGVTWSDAVWFHTSPTKVGATRLNPTINRWTGALTMVPGSAYSTFPNPINLPVIRSIPVVPLGVYYVGYECDRLAETPGTTADNIRWIQVHVDQRPDFVIENASVQAAVVQPGGVLQTSFTLHNLGGTSGIAQIRAAVYLSSSPTTPPVAADRLGTTGLYLVGAGASLSFGGAPPVPNLPWGTYYVIFAADDTNSVYESDESNNHVVIPVQVGPVATASAYGSGCAGTHGVPTLASAGVPQLGNVVDLDVSTQSPFAIVVLVEGVSSFAVPVPGAAGCELLVSLDLLSPLLADAAGAAHFQRPIPGDPSLLGTHFYSQAWILDPAANSFGFVGSNGIDLAIGF